MLRTDEQLAQQQPHVELRSKYVTEGEMAAYLRAQQVRTILDFGFHQELSIDEVRPLSDQRSRCRPPSRRDLRALAADRPADRRGGRGGVSPLRRGERPGSSASAFARLGRASRGDPIYDPFSRRASALDRPVLVLVGTPARGPGSRAAAACCSTCRTPATSTRCRCVTGPA